MTARWLAAAAVVLVPRLAAAEPQPQPHKVLVMQSEGRADAGLRARIDAAITRLAAAAQLQASAGELTFTDAATAVGCRPDAPSCKNEVIGMLSVRCRVRWKRDFAGLIGARRPSPWRSCRRRSGMPPARRCW